MKDAKGTSRLGSIALQQAMRMDLPGGDLPPTGKSQQGELPDLENIKKVVANDYEAAFKGAALPSDTLAQFDALYPFLSDLRLIAISHSLFRLPEDYAISPPVLRPFSPITDQIKVSKLLTLHAILALAEHRPQVALDDIELNYQIVSSIKRDPTLVAGLVCIGMNAITISAISYGLDSHAWNDAQLAEIESTLGPIDFLAGYQFAMRGECTYSIANFDFFSKYSHCGNFFARLLSGKSNQNFADRIIPPWPLGWWDLNKSGVANSLLGSISLADPKDHRVFAERADRIQAKFYDSSKRWPAFLPWNILHAISAPPLLNSLLAFTHGQVWIDQIRIACALERYHLRHGVYPGALAALVPDSMDNVPLDPITGSEYRYSIRPDSTFLLYSVGWNQKDDGGVGVFVLKNSTNPNDSAQRHGDWVWPTPK